MSRFIKQYCVHHFALIRENACHQTQKHERSMQSCQAGSGFPCQCVARRLEWTGCYFLLLCLRRRPWAMVPWQHNPLKQFDCSPSFVHNANTHDHHGPEYVLERVRMRVSVEVRFACVSPLLLCFYHASSRFVASLARRECWGWDSAGLPRSGDEFPTTTLGRLTAVGTFYAGASDWECLRVASRCLQLPTFLGWYRAGGHQADHRRHGNLMA